MDVFHLDQARALLVRTPMMLDTWLRGLPAAWLLCDEGEDTWNAHGVLGHLIEGERTDWIPRIRHLLEHGEAVPFPPFDRFTQFALPERSAEQLLDEFGTARRRSLEQLDLLDLHPDDLERTGRHPEFGVVTLGQHLATWAAHDLTHVTQIARVMARRYSAAVGPWRAYLRVMHG